jgi:hypothetical protein
VNETLHTLALEILKAKNNLSTLSATEVHKAYREIYAELQRAEKAFVAENPSMKILK